MLLSEDRAKAIARLAAEEVELQIEHELDAHPLRYGHVSGDVLEHVGEEAGRVVYDMLRGFEL